MDPDHSTIQRMQEGDEQALTELMQRHKESVFRLAWRYTGNEQDAIEITEETFVRAYFKCETYRPRGKVKTWLFTIASNLCKDLFRSRKKERGQVSLDTPVGEDGTSTIRDTIGNNESDARQSAESREQLQAIETAIHALPHKLKFPFIFCIIEEHSYDECADILHTTRKTVETRIYRARLKLREILDDFRQKI